MEVSDAIIFWLVLGARTLVPLLIPYFPLPGIVAALILDAVDHPIFYRFTSVNMDRYQSYDKALDIYYLVIAYIATLRNWTNHFAFRVSRFLLYYRLVGVLLFELTQIRGLLFVFTNTFEYFFIFYEAVRLRWQPERIVNRVWLWGAIAITVFIKLPQEYIVHISPLHITALINKYIFRVEDLEQKVMVSMQMRPEITLLLIGLAIGALLLVRWIVIHKLPPADWKPKLKAESIPRLLTTLKARKTQGIWTPELREKTLMLVMLIWIFANILTEVKATMGQLALGVVILVVVNTLISAKLGGKGWEWRSAATEFLAMAGANILLVWIYAWLLPRYEGAVDLTNTLVLVGLLTLMVTLYDRYRVVYLNRWGDKG